MFPAAPKILNMEKYKDEVLLYANKSVIFEVMFSSAPQPKVKWQYNGGQLPDFRRTTEETIYGMTSLTISRAKRSDTGTYTLKLDNKSGSATLSIKVKVIDKPKAPNNLLVKDITGNSMHLRWSPPPEDGGSPVTGYIVEKKEGNKRMWQSVTTTEADETEFQVANLFEGNSYAFRVTAENKVGQGEPTELSDLVTAKSKFCKYTRHFTYSLTNYKIICDSSMI